MFEKIIEFIKSLYPGQNPIPLHAPVFLSKEKKYLQYCIDSTMVSYVGEFVEKFELETSKFTRAKYAIATVNGTTALQVALKICGVKATDEVLTQPLTFVATANAIVHNWATPVFIDVDIDTLGMSPEKLECWLIKNTRYDSKRGGIINKTTKNRIAAIVPMHTFGFPCKIDEIIEVAIKYNIPVIEDAAEALGSFYTNQHVGTFGKAGILSYNGNKIITTGGGGMILTNDKEIAEKAKHLTTTAKIKHRYEFTHDQIAFNYRLPNINAAIGVSQMEVINKYLANKRETSKKYKKFFDNFEIKYIDAPKNSKPNFWLNTILFKDYSERTNFLEITNRNGINTRPVWRLINQLDMYKNYQCGDISNSEMLCKGLVNLPSSYRIK